MKTPFLSFIYLVFAAVLVSVTFTSANATIVKAKSHNYIIQVSRETRLEAFMDAFSRKIEGFFHELFEDIKEGFEDLFGRDNEINYQLHRSYNIGGRYKAISVHIKDGRVIDKIPHHFNQVVSIIPDDEISFDLTIPKARKIDKRYYIRTVVLRNTTASHDQSKSKEKSFRPVSSSRANASKKITTTASKTTTTTAPKKSTTTSLKKSTTTASKKTATTAPKKTATTAPKKPTFAAANIFKFPAFPLTNSTKHTYVTQKPQTSTPWNLIRTSEREINFSRPYTYDSRAGQNVTVYVVDDGINISHEDFQGRARYGYSAFPMTSTSSSTANSERDGGGHGTHVAGIIGGKHYGVAKKVNLVSVQVLKPNGKGTISSLLGGIQWVMEHSKNATGPVLINMSLGVPSSVSGSKSLDDAVSAVVDAGIPVFAAAGNSASDACDIIPAGNSKVFTVGTVTSEDEMDTYSCYGSCVNILAPGFDITSAFTGSTNATAVMSGSSMASPHVAGAAALLLPYMKDATPQKLYDELSKIATKGKITGIPDELTPNKLLFNGQNAN